MTDLERLGHHVGEVRKMESPWFAALYDELHQPGVDRFQILATQTFWIERHPIFAKLQHVPGFTCGAGKV